MPQRTAEHARQGPLASIEIPSGAAKENFFAVLRLKNAVVTGEGHFNAAQVVHFRASQELATTPRLRLAASLVPEVGDKHAG